MAETEGASSEEDLKRRLAQCMKDLDTVYQRWKRDRRKLIVLLREIADDIQKHEENSRIAKITGSSASIVGTGLAIGGGIAAIFTFGASLILTGVGVGIAVAGGTTVAGAEITNHLLRHSNVKTVNKALQMDREETQNLKDQLEKVDKIAKEFELEFVSKDFAKPCIEMAFNVGKMVVTAVNLTKATVGEAGETVFRTLGTASRALHIVGIVASFVTLPIDIHTLVTTALAVHRKSIVDVVKYIRNQAKLLEDELNLVSKSLD